MAKKGILEHPKTLTLADALGIMDCFAVGILETFWHHVGKYHDDGDISDLKPSILARSIRYSGDPQQLWDALIYAGFIDTGDDKTIVHDWPHHCEDSIHSRLFRAIRCFADGSKPLPKNLGKDEKAELEKAWASGGDLESTNKVSEKPLPKPKPKPKPSIGSEPNPEENEFFERVKSEYPNRYGDLGWKKAEPKINSIPLKEREAVLVGVVNYRKYCGNKGNIGTEFVKQAPTFFNGETWREFQTEPAPSNGKPKELYHDDI
jgi:hypothetical protein